MMSNQQISISPVEEKYLQQYIAQTQLCLEHDIPIPEITTLNVLRYYFKSLKESNPLYRECRNLLVNIHLRIL